MERKKRRGAKSTLPGPHPRAKGHETPEFQEQVSRTKEKLF